MFTREELFLPFQQLEDNLGKDNLSPDVVKDIDQEQLFKMVSEALAKMFTPERWHKFHHDVENTARKWMLSMHPWGAALYAETGFLDKNQYEENRFIIIAFFGQLRRMTTVMEGKPSKKRA